MKTQTKSKRAATKSRAIGRDAGKKGAVQVNGMKSLDEQLDDLDEATVDQRQLGFHRSLVAEERRAGTFKPYERSKAPIPDLEQRDLDNAFAARIARTEKVPA